MGGKVPGLGGTIECSACDGKGETMPGIWIHPDENTQFNFFCSKMHKQYPSRFPRSELTKEEEWICTHVLWQIISIHNDEGTHAISTTSYDDAREQYDKFAK